MSLRILAIALAGTVGVAGCTSLQTLPDTYSSASPAQALRGYPYALPMRQYDLVVTWSLDECANRVPATGEAIDPSKPLQTTISAKVASTPLLTPGERYLLDYRSLGGITKTSDVTIETYPEGTLKAVNAAAEDRSAEIIANVARVGIALASMTAGGPPPPPPLTENVLPPSVVVGCSHDALKYLDAVKTAKGNLEVATEAVEKQAAAVEDLVLVGLYDTARRSELLTALQALRTLNGKLDDAKTALAKARKPLQRTLAQRWPTDFGAPIKVGEPLTMSKADRDTFDKLFSLVDLEREKREGDCTGGIAVCVDQAVPVLARIVPASGDLPNCPKVPGANGVAITFACLDVPPKQAPKPLGQDETPTARLRYQEEVDAYRFLQPVAARDRKPDKGLFIRPPAQGRLVVCGKTTDCKQGQDGTLLWDELMTVPQLGQLRFLPFENKMFQNNALVLSLLKDGTVEKFQFASKASVAEKLTAAAATVAEGMVSGRKAIRDERTAKRAERLAELDYEIGLKEKRAKLAPAPPASTDAVEGEADAAQKIALKIELEIEDKLIEIDSDGGAERAGTRPPMGLAGQAASLPNEVRP